jgi:hypothetical protein
MRQQLTDIDAGSSKPIVQSFAVADRRCRPLHVQRTRATQLHIEMIETISNYIRPLRCELWAIAALYASMNSDRSAVRRIDSLRRGGRA